MQGMSSRRGRGCAAAAGCLALLLMLLPACRRQDIRTARLTVPQMRTPECAERVVGILSQQAGVQGQLVQADLPLREVTVPYDSLLLSLKNLEYALAEAGFDANDIPADPEARARLPEAWR